MFFFWAKEGKKILKSIHYIYLILLKTYEFSCPIVNEAHVESIYIAEKQMVQSLPAYVHRGYARIRYTKN